MVHTEHGTNRGVLIAGAVGFTSVGLMGIIAYFLLEVFASVALAVSDSLTKRIDKYLNQGRRQILIGGALGCFAKGLMYILQIYLIGRFERGLSLTIISYGYWVGAVVASLGVSWAFTVMYRFKAGPSSSILMFFMAASFAMYALAGLPEAAYQRRALGAVAILFQAAAVIDLYFGSEQPHTPFMEWGSWPTTIAIVIAFLHYTIFFWVGQYMMPSSSATLHSRWGTQLGLMAGDFMLHIVAVVFAIVFYNMSPMIIQLLKRRFGNVQAAEEGRSSLLTTVDDGVTLQPADD